MIARSDYEEFADIASAASSEALADFERFWANLDFSDVAAAREAAIEYAMALIETYGDAAATNAADFFELATKTKNAFLADAGNAERTSQVVRYAMKLVIDGEPENALSTIKADINLQIQGAGRDTIIENARKKKARFARVPRGDKTCAFCVMLASRGWVYHTKETAGDLNRFHPHCDCQIVAGLPGDTLEGYDPDALYERYRDCRKVCGSGDEKAILAEMRTRDRVWLNGGDPPEPKCLKPKDSFRGDDARDLFAHDALSRHGFAITVLAEDAPDGFSNIDLMINGQKWEVKSPTSQNTRSVESNLRRAKRQFLGQYNGGNADTRVVFNGSSMDIDDGEITREIERMMRKHGIIEVFQVFKDGTIKRLRQ